MINISENKLKYYGIYRGIVVDNIDTGLTNGTTNRSFGRVKIFFDGIYPEAFKSTPVMLPWAEPVFPIFGGNAYSETQKIYDEKTGANINKNWTNKYTGWCSVPHVGAYVWGFFEDGNINYPKFFGTTQASNNWTSEHANQHVFISDNVKIVIDENPLHILSTNKFDSNNKENTSTVENLDSLKRTKMPTTVNIEITAIKPESLKDDESDLGKQDNETYPDNTYFAAINLNIIGNVNSKIKGNVYEEIEGDKFITHRGNTYIKHKGDLEVEHEGFTKITHTGNRNFKVDGDNFETITGNEKRSILKDFYMTVAGNYVLRGLKGILRWANSQINDKCQLIKHN